jgi:hypothetical protein
MLASKPLDLYELYQEIPVGTDEGELPPGTYTIYGRLAVMATSGENDDSGTGGSRFTTQRLFATTGTENNKVQYFGRTTDYDQNLTSGEDATFAGWVAENGSGSGARLRPVAVTITVSDGETLRLGIKTSKLKKDGSSGTATDTGWFKTDDFRIIKIDTPEPDNYTAQIVNPNFELLAANTPIAGKYDNTVRFVPYGWTHQLVKDYNSDSEPIILPWSATENNGNGTETEGGAAYGQSVGCNYGDANITVVPGNYYCFWASAANATGMPEYTLYQDIVGLPAGKYHVSALMYVQTDRLRTQRLFANNSVQFFATETDYNLENQLTREEKTKLADGDLDITYAENALGYNFQPVSVDVTIAAGETLRLGVKSSSVDKEGITSTGQNYGIFRIDDFHLKQLEDHTSTAITPAAKAEATYVVNNGILTVNGVDAYTVYSISGAKIADVKGTSIDLLPGAYIVKTKGSGTLKVLVK